MTTTSWSALPLFHIFGLSSIMNTCVLLGGTMSLVPRFEAAAVLDVIQRDRATVFEGVPTMFVALLQAPGLASYDLSSLRVAISGGAPIPAEITDSFERRFGVTILEGYGLSETASTTTFNVSAAERKIYSVGKPIWGVSVQVWDSQGLPLPPGTEHVGEIVVRGPNVMTGYHNNPEATAAAFAGWFHTGDLGYFDEDGFLFIVDRIKHDYPRRVQRVPPRGRGGHLHSSGRRRGGGHRRPRRHDGRRGARHRGHPGRAVGDRGRIDRFR